MTDPVPPDATHKGVEIRFLRTTPDGLLQTFEVTVTVRLGDASLTRQLNSACASRLGVAEVKALAILFAREWIDQNR